MHAINDHGLATLGVHLDEIDRPRLVLPTLVTCCRHRHRGLLVLVHRDELIAEGKHAAAATVPFEQGYLAIAAAVADDHPLGSDERDQAVDIYILCQQIKIAELASNANTLPCGPTSQPSSVVK
jgi:hypothetical protein